MKKNLGSITLSLLLMSSLAIMGTTYTSTIKRQATLRQYWIENYSTRLNAYCNEDISGRELLNLLDLLYKNNSDYPKYSTTLMFDSDSFTDAKKILELRKRINSNHTYSVKIAKYSPEGLIKKIIITNLSAQEVEEFNSTFETYFGDSISGSKLIELLNLIADNNTNNPTHIIGLDPNFTSKNGTKLSGQNNYDPNYIRTSIIPHVSIYNKYIIKVTSLSTAYSKDGFIQRITFADKSTLTSSEVKKFNDTFDVYIGEDLNGKEVKTLIKKIKVHNETQFKNGTDKMVRILFHINPQNSADNKTHYMLTGIGVPHLSNPDYLLEEMNFIKEDTNYYVDIHKYNPDQTIYSFVIADSYNKAQYIDAYK